jgi:hypothetical protein
LAKQYISDVITQSEIAKWKPRDRILIHSQTGTGKSQWVKDPLRDYAVKINKKILMFSNRSALKKQNMLELGDEQKTITLKNYQSLESAIIYGNEIDNLLSNFFIIVFDECHYLLNDSVFNKNTDLLINKLKFPNKDKIFIFITATPQAILSYHSTFEYTYSLPTDYSYIKNIYFYSKTETINNILHTIPNDDQALYFGNAMESYDLHNLFKDSSNFICSDNNIGFSRKSSKRIIEQIEKESRFDNKILFSTKILDNGINLIAPKLKHIIIDMLNPIDVVQCLGRKRIVNEDDYINLYIKNFHKGEALFQIKKIKSIMAYVDELNELGQEEFSKKYNRVDIDNIIHKDYTINYAKYYYLKFMRTTLYRILDDKENLGYKKEIMGLLQLDINKVKIAESYYEAVQIKDIMDKYAEKKLFRDGELDNFRTEFFENLFSPQRTRDIRNRGYKTINSILEEDNLPYCIKSTKETGGENKCQHYWYIHIMEEKDG